MNIRTAFLFLLLPGVFAFAGVPSGPVQIWVSSQADLKYYQNMAEVYRQKVDPAFNAEIKSFGFMDMPTKLSLAIKSGIEVPDIVQLDEIFFSLYLKGNVPFVDLTDRLQKSPLGTGILPQRMGLFTWKDRVYGVPQSTSGVVLWYRDDIFKELKITPNDIDTWDKFEAVGRRVGSGARKLIALDWSYLEILLRQRGFDLFSSDGKLFADSARIIETWKRIAGWSRDTIGVLPDRGSIFEPAFYNAYVTTNGILTLIGPDWFGLDMIQNFDPGHKGKWRAMPLPVWTDSLSRGRRNTSSFSGQGLVIFKKSMRIEPSWKFVEWVMSDVDANVERFLQGNCFTAYKPAWADLRFSRKDPFFGDQVLGQLFMDIAPNLPFTVQSPAHAAIANFLRENYFTAVLRNVYTPEDAMRQIQETMAKMAAGKKP